MTKLKDAASALVADISAGGWAHWHEDALLGLAGELGPGDAYAVWCAMEAAGLDRQQSSHLLERVFGPFGALNILKETGALPEGLLGRLRDAAANGEGFSQAYEEFMGLLANAPAEHLNHYLALHGPLSAVEAWVSGQEVTHLAALVTGFAVLGAELDLSQWAAGGDLSRVTATVGIHPHVAQHILSSPNIFGLTPGHIDALAVRRGVERLNLQLVPEYRNIMDRELEPLGADETLATPRGSGPLWGSLHGLLSVGSEFDEELAYHLAAASAEELIQFFMAMWHLRSFQFAKAPLTLRVWANHPHAVEAVRKVSDRTSLVSGGAQGLFLYTLGVIQPEAMGWDDALAAVARTEAWHAAAFIPASSGRVPDDFHWRVKYLRYETREVGGVMSTLPLVRAAGLLPLGVQGLLPERFLVPGDASSGLSSVAGALCALVGGFEPDEMQRVASAVEVALEPVDVYRILVDLSTISKVAGVL